MSFTDWPWRHWRETRSANKPALRFDDDNAELVCSWASVSTRLAAGFQAQGVNPEDGDGVMLLARNRPAGGAGLAGAACSAARASCR